MHIKYLIILSTILLMTWSVPTYAAEVDNGVIKGQLINETVDGSSVADQEITLSIYFNDSELDTITTKTNGEGQFVFNGLSTEPGYSYSIMTIFQGAEYYSDWLSYNKDQTNLAADIIVYDATNNNDAITIAMSHTIIYVEEDSLLVKEYYLFINNDDRTYVGPGNEIGPAVLHFSLPEGATEKQYTMGLMECCIIENEDGFGETMPVLPGSREVAYSYRIIPNSSRYSHFQSTDYPINRYDFLVQGADIDMSSKQLIVDEPLDIGGTNFSHLSGQDFSSRDIVHVRISNLPWRNNLAGYWWILLAVVLIFAIFIPVYLKKKKSPETIGAFKDDEVLQQQLLTEIASLDENFESGKISETEHSRLRSEKKAELIKLIRNSKGE